LDHTALPPSLNNYARAEFIDLDRTRETKEKANDGMRIQGSTHSRTALIPITICFMLWFGSAADAAQEQVAASASNASAQDEDLTAFKRLRGNLIQLTDQIERRTDLFGPRPAQDATLLRPDVRTEIRAIWYALLDNYLALDALAAKCVRFYRVKDKPKRIRTFHLARGVFLTQYRVALEVIAVLEQNPVMDTILNEADAPLGLPEGVYGHFKYQYLNVAKAGRYTALEAVAKVYKAPRDPQLAQWAEQDSRLILDAGKGPGPLMTLKNGLAILNRAGHNAWFPLQKEVAEWMGHTKVWRPHTYLIRPEQIGRISQVLEPGDILLERREWYLTNVGIPGFWTHAALFIGSAEQRAALSRDAQVLSWLQACGAKSLDDLIAKRYPGAYAEMQIPCGDGRLPRVIEALSPGVCLTSLHHSATCDSLAILRPRLSKTDRAAAVVRAMRYFGRPYDYAFDFGSDQSLVCTELIVKAYLPDRTKKGLKLPLERLMGNLVTPANAFVRQFDQTYGTGNQQMDLVLFLDGSEKVKRAAEADLSTFRKSWNRPKWHILVQDDGMQKP
jgi:hypothetical protein